MTPRVFLELGRVSNLPTVWSNVLAGALIAGPFALVPVLAIALAGSLFYTGGMLLNDAFDAEIDSRERPERPIPSGRVSRASVLGTGFGLVFAGIATLLVLALLGHSASGARVVWAGLFTAAAVIAYDLWHKGRPLSPVIMGLCRAGLYAMAGLAVSESLSGPAVETAVSVLAYVVGLTHIARFETGSVVARAWPTLFVLGPSLLCLLRLRDVHGEALALSAGTLLVSVSWSLRAIRIALRGGPGSIPRSVISLIAGLSLTDAAFVAARAGAPGVLACFACFGLTLALQRRIRGT
jgi:4-hydroxybenzoate polyprenyltransferase